MNFLDSFLEKIPIIRDMDKKKRILAAGFLVFAFISLIGIIIDSIAEAGGVVALLSVAIGFLLMAALIIADFILSRKAPPEYPREQEQYNFYDDNPDDYGYQDESSYIANDRSVGNYDSPDFSDDMMDDNFGDDMAFRDDGNYQDDFGYQDEKTFNDGQDYRDDGIEYTVTPHPSLSHVSPDVRETNQEPAIALLGKATRVHVLLSPLQVSHCLLDTLVR